MILQRKQERKPLPLAKKSLIPRQNSELIMTKEMCTFPMMNKVRIYVIHMSR